MRLHNASSDVRKRLATLTLVPVYVAGAILLWDTFQHFDCTYPLPQILMIIAIVILCAVAIALDRRKIAWTFPPLAVGLLYALCLPDAFTRFDSFVKGGICFTSA